MAWKTTVRRCIIQESVKNHKYFGRPIQKNIFERMEKRLPKKFKPYLLKSSRNIFNLFLRICCKLSFVRFSSDCQGNVTMEKTKWELVAHYSVIVLQIVRMLSILVITVNRAMSGILDLTTFRCIGAILPFSVGFLLSASLLLKPHETVQIINASPIILSYYQRDGGEPLTMFHNPKNAIFIIVVALIVSSAVLLVPALGFLVDQLPVSLYHIADFIFGRPEFIPYFLWKLLFWPLELLSYAHIMTVAGFSGMLFLTLPNISLTCTNAMRKMRVNSVESWLELRRKYYLVQVCGSLANSWTKFMVVPAMFCISLTIVITLYITIRHTNIATLAYVAVAAIGVSLVIILFWVAFEAIHMIQSSEAIVATLNSRDELYYFELPPAQQLYLKKYGKATRPLVFDVGDFVDYSIDVPLRVWDEILNQLLFMLTF